MNLRDGKLDGPAPEVVKDTNTESFVEDVLQPSQQTPVLVDFWAEWCEPCKTLTPALEKVVKEQGGAVLLAKLNVDENQELAAQIGIQSLPTVVAFQNGRPVDAFAGAMPEGEIRKFIEKLGAKSAQAEEGADLMEMAKAALGAGQAGQAADLFAKIAQEDATNVEALGGLAHAHALSGKREEAEKVLASVPEDKKNSPAVSAARAALEFAAKGVDEGEVENLRKKVAANGDDFEARYQLAEALFAKGERDEAADHLFHIIRKNRGWNDEAARKLLLKMFEAAGPKDPFTLEKRRQLSSLLFS